MPRAAPVASPKRHGCIGARRWQDIRQAARVVRTEGVTLNVHGIIVSPETLGKDLRPATATRSEKTVGTVPDTRKQPVEPTGEACANMSKKKQRSMQRFLANRERMRPPSAAENRWALLAKKVMRVSNFHIRSRVWVEWMQDLPLREAMKATFPPTAVVATAVGGDPAMYADMVPIEEGQTLANSTLPLDDHGGTSADTPASAGVISRLSSWFSTPSAATSTTTSAAPPVAASAPPPSGNRGSAKKKKKR